MSIGSIAQGAIQRVRDTRDYIDEKAAALVSPKGARGISGFVFDVIEDESLSVQADVTDHYTENGSYINDHIVIKPIQVTLRGFIGELVIKRSPIQEAFAQITNRLTAIDAYTGSYTPGMVQRLNRTVSDAQRAVQDINNAVDRAGNFISEIAGQEGVFLARQKEAYSTLYALMVTKQILTVTLPWTFLSDMVIMSINPSQGSDTESWSEFSITLKQLRFAVLERTDFDENLLPPRQEIQEEEETDQGLNSGEGDRGSLLFQAAEGFGLEF